MRGVVRCGAGRWRARRGDDGRGAQRAAKAMKGDGGRARGRVCRRPSPRMPDGFSSGAQRSGGRETADFGSLRRRFARTQALSGGLSSSDQAFSRPCVRRASEIGGFPPPKGAHQAATHAWRPGGAARRSSGRWSRLSSLRRRSGALPPRTSQNAASGVSRIAAGRKVCYHGQVMFSPAAPTSADHARGGVA